MFQYNTEYMFKGDKGPAKEIVANLAIYPNSSSFTFTNKENAYTLWAG